MSGRARPWPGCRSASCRTSAVSRGGTGRRTAGCTWAPRTPSPAPGRRRRTARGPQIAQAAPGLDPSSGFRRTALVRGAALDVVTVDDLADARILALTPTGLPACARGRPDAQVEGGGDALGVDGRMIAVHAERDTGRLPWGEPGIGLVVESPASAPESRSAPGGGHPRGPHVCSVHHIVSAASRTTNCLAAPARAPHRSPTRSTVRWANERRASRRRSVQRVRDARTGPGGRRHPRDARTLRG